MINTSFKIDPIDESSVLKPEEFAFFAHFMMENTGISLEESKRQMVQSRLVKRLHKTGANDFNSYIQIIQTDSSEATECINALTTHKTEFFREFEHFKFLTSTVLPEIVSRTQKINIWSAACSSGEEVYSVAMTSLKFIESQPHFKSTEVRLLGTDIDTAVIEKAHAGIYTAESVTRIPDTMIKAYFLKGSGVNRNLFRVKPELSQSTKFRQHNLLEPFSLSANLKFDIVFLRNVLIYFNEKTRLQVISNVIEPLKKGGYLFVGHSESLTGIDTGLKRIGNAIYQKI